MKTGRPTLPVPPELWESIVREKALIHHVDAAPVFAGARRKPALRARWAAWREIASTGKYTVNQIALVGGFDHTTVRSALRRMERGEGASS